MNEDLVFHLAGFYHFTSKDKENTYYVVQALNIQEESEYNKKGTLINIFVDSNVYDAISNMEIGACLNVLIIPNLETGKLHYKLVI